MCWYCSLEISSAGTSLYGCFVQPHHHLRLRRLDALHTTMDQVFDLDPLGSLSPLPMCSGPSTSTTMDQAYDLNSLGSLSPLPMYGGPSSSCLNHLAAPGIRLDAEPFLNSLRQVYKDEFTTAVTVSVLRYRDQLLELEQAFPPQVEDSLQGNTLCFVDHTL